jgi:hypothetical protein
MTVKLVLKVCGVAALVLLVFVEARATRGT